MGTVLLMSNDPTSPDYTRIVLADFGMAAHRIGISDGKHVLETLHGTPEFAAPELLILAKRAKMPSPKKHVTLRPSASRGDAAPTNNSPQRERRPSAAASPGKLLSFDHLARNDGYSAGKVLTLERTRGHSIASCRDAQHDAAMALHAVTQQRTRGCGGGHSKGVAPADHSWHGVGTVGLPQPGITYDRLRADAAPFRANSNAAAYDKARRNSFSGYPLDDDPGHAPGRGAGMVRGRSGPMEEDAQDKYTCLVDIWAAGAVLYVMLSAHTPFCNKGNIPRMVKKIIEGRYDFRAELWRQVSDEAKGMIRTMMVVSPYERPSALQCLVHPFVIGRPGLEIPEINCRASTPFDYDTQGSSLRYIERDQWRTASLERMEMEAFRDEFPAVLSPLARETAPINVCMSNL
jgi:serine/threonine protein kinase